MYENEQLLLYWKFAYLTRARFLLPQYGLSWVRMIIVNWALFQLYELIKISLMSLLTMKFGLIQYSILLLIYITERFSWFSWFTIAMSPRLEINSNSEANQKFFCCTVWTYLGLIAILSQLQLKNLSVHAWLLCRSFNSSKNNYQNYFLPHFCEICLF